MVGGIIQERMAYNAGWRITKFLGWEAAHPQQQIPWYTRNGLHPRPPCKTTSEPHACSLCLARGPLSSLQKHLHGLEGRPQLLSFCSTVAVCKQEQDGICLF